MSSSESGYDSSSSSNSIGYETAITFIAVFIGLAFCWSLRRYAQKPRAFRKDVIAVFGGKGSNGIGWEIVKRMHRQGSRVVIVDRQRPPPLMPDCTFLMCDVQTREAVNKVAQEIVKQVGWPTVVVNCVGIVNGKFFLDLTDAEIEKIVNINLMSHMWVAREFLPEMIRHNNGHLVTFGSSMGFVGTSKLADYCATKAALYSFNEALRLELRIKQATSVRTTVVCPGYVTTGMFEGIKMRFPLLTPPLTPQYVAGRVVTAVMWGDEAEIWLPLFVHGVPLLRILPTWLYDYLQDFFGVNTAMDTFVGRQPVDQ